MRKHAKQRVLDTAAELLDRGGHERFTLFALSVNSEVSNGSIYHHFRSKEGVVIALLRRTLVAYHKAVGAPLAAYRADAQAGVHALVREHLAWTEAHPRDARLLMRERALVVSGERSLHDANVIFAARLQRWFDAHAEAGRLPHLDAEVARAVLFGPAQVIVDPWLRRLTDVAPTAHAEHLGDAAWAGLRAAGG